MFRRKIPGKKTKRDEWDFFDDELKTFKAGYKSPCLSILQAMTSIYQGKKKRYMERLYCPRWTIESQPYMSRCKKGNPEGFPVLKERTVFALVTPFCCSLVSLSGPQQFPVLPPTFPFPRLLDQSCCPNPSAVLSTWLPWAPSPQRSLAMLLQALAGFLRSKFQIIPAQEFTPGISPCCKACLSNTGQSCLVQADKKHF